MGGVTAEIMCQILAFEADRRAFLITINSFGTELTKEDRSKLYPRCGRLHPYGLSALAKADDFDQVRHVAEYYAVGSDHVIYFGFSWIMVTGSRFRSTKSSSTMPAIQSVIKHWRTNSSSMRQVGCSWYLLLLYLEPLMTYTLATSLSSVFFRYN